jgi:hypothetical protein
MEGLELNKPTLQNNDGCYVTYLDARTIFNAACEEWKSVPDIELKEASSGGEGSFDVEWSSNGSDFVPSQGGNEVVAITNLVVPINDNHIEYAAKYSNWIYEPTLNQYIKTKILLNSATNRGFYWATDPYLNPYNENDYLYYYLLNVLKHELGHLIGLGHNPNSSSIMRVSFDPGDYNPQSFELNEYYRSTDDLEAERFLIYPIMEQSGKGLQAHFLTISPQIEFMKANSEKGVLK